jgi:tetratricopeptide (TPR) repeat protein
MDPREPPYDRVVGRREIGTDGNAFVGRERELRVLQEELAETSSGRGRLVTIVGDAGIGKTRIIEEFVSRAADAPSRTLWGRCPEQGGAPAYWPWIDAIRKYVAGCEPGCLAADLGASAHELTQLVPEIRGLLPDLDLSPVIESDEWRFRLCDRVVEFLRRASARNPLVIVLDDLHWSDAASLQLLAFVAPELRSMRLLLVASHRTGEMRDGPALHEGLARASQRLELRGLGADDIARLVEAKTGTVPAPGLVADVQRITEGNPFFVGEFVQMLQAEGALGSRDLASARLKLPAELGATIRRRFASLTAEQRRLLEVAAVVGRDFDVVLLQAACELPRDRVLGGLEPVLSARLIEEVSGALGSFRFAHALIREALYEDLTPTVRAQLHGRIGRALESVGDGSPERLPALAHHFFHAATLGDAATALAYVERAGHEASARLGHEEAVGHFERALQLCAVLPPDEPRQLALHLALGKAAALASDNLRARETFERAARMAERVGDRESRVQAALGYREARAPTGVIDPTEVRLLEGALAVLGQGDSGLRARVMLALGRALLYDADPSRWHALVDEALAVARRVGDPAAIANALLSMHFRLYGPTDLGERLAIIREAIETAENTRAPGLAFDCRVALVHDLLEAGDVAAAEREIDVLASRAEQRRLPLHRWIVAVLRAGLLISSGRVEEGARLAARALEIRRDGQDPAVLQTYCGQIFVARRELGNLGAQLEESMAAFVDTYPGMHSWRCTLAVVHAEAGRTEAARALLERIGSRGFTDVPRDVHFFPALAMLAEAVHLLRDGARAAQLYPLLLPYADRNVVASWWSPTYVGSVARYLGLLASTAGRPYDAAAHFEQALVANTRMGVRGQLAHTKVDYARVLLARNSPGDADTALRLVTEAGETAEQLGLVRLRERIARLKLPPRTVPAGPWPLEQTAILRREGQEWTIGIGHERLRLKDGPGLAYLAILVHEPGREFHVLDLAIGRDTPEAARVDRGDAGDLLDSAARAAYKRRLVDLEAELDEAERFNDAGRMARAHEEREFLTAELARAVGLGGRSRRAGSASERARVNVTRVLGRTIDKIAEASPTLGQHLAAAVRRGTYCSYTPDPRLTLHWET